MNQKRRKILGNAKAHIVAAKDLVTEVAEDERESLENIPENLQESDSYFEREDALDNLEDIIYDLGSLEEQISEML